MAAFWTLMKRSRFCMGMLVFTQPAPLPVSGRVSKQLLLFVWPADTRPSGWNQAKHQSILRSEASAPSLINRASSWTDAFRWDNPVVVVFVDTCLYWRKQRNNPSHLTAHRNINMIHLTHTQQNKHLKSPHTQQNNPSLLNPQRHMQQLPSNRTINLDKKTTRGRQKKTKLQINSTGYYPSIHKLIFLCKTCTHPRKQNNSSQPNNTNANITNYYYQYIKQNRSIKSTYIAKAKIFILKQYFINDTNVTS